MGDVLGQIQKFAGQYGRLFFVQTQDAGGLGEPLVRGLQALRVLLVSGGLLHVSRGSAVFIRRVSHAVHCSQGGMYNICRSGFGF